MTASCAQPWEALGDAALWVCEAKVAVAEGGVLWGRHQTSENLPPVRVWFDDRKKLR